MAIGRVSVNSSVPNILCVIRFQSIDFTSTLLERGTFAIFRTISDVTNGGLYSRCRFRPLRDFKDRTFLFALLTLIRYRTYSRSLETSRILSLINTVMMITDSYQRKCLVEYFPLPQNCKMFDSISSNLKSCILQNCVCRHSC